MLTGKNSRSCKLNKDGDAWLVPFAPHDILILRMR